MSNMTDTDVPAVTTNLPPQEPTKEAIQAPAVFHSLPTLVPLGFGLEEPSSQEDRRPESHNELTVDPASVIVVVEGEMAEHAYLGDGVILQKGADQTKRLIAAKVPISLPNGLSLTYGQINWLAGDFYGTSTPISDGSVPDGCIENFKKAFDTLAIRAEAKAEAEKIIAYGQAEIDAVNNALRAGKDPSTTVYSKGSIFDNMKLIYETWYRADGEGYLGLATKNFDHFGEDARKAYDAGHALAVDAASKGDLNLGYAYNAFADHFLQDTFSAGHMRTPRRILHEGGIAGDACAKLMHDEDSAIGLEVANPANETWTAFGDKRILDFDNSRNKRRCKDAVQASVDEVIDAFNSPSLPRTIGGAWAHAPTLESARDMDKQRLSPLFTPDGQVRNSLSDRTDKGHHSMPAHLVVWGHETIIPVPASAWFTKIAAEYKLVHLSD